MTVGPPSDPSSPDPYGAPQQPQYPGQLPPQQSSPAQPYGYPPQPGYPQGPYGYPQAPYGTPPDPDAAGKSRTKAVWALVLAILPCCLTQIASVVLALIVLVGPRDGQSRGRGMAWSSLVIVLLWIVGVVVAVVVGITSIPAERDSQGNVISGGEQLPESVRVGDCLDEDVSEPSAKGISVTVIPCDEPHPGEVYDEIEIESISYPGEADIRQTAEAGCAERFEAFVGTPLESSELDVSYFYPTRDNWDYDGMIRCIVVPPEDVTGTLEGSGR
ncbi:DUF4190 domain-containing protein [Aeromicrobium sp. Leaf350]|uniref:DUF4190 domain-containing protein n=1 Tax=Aeromicrobium sp. Leaf350 TaxID=2876565 RepID=UPI001E57FB38|nr:DUF4190 domain-containing protein [Aeromicrobium sp. Leaf350]